MRNLRSAVPVLVALVLVLSAAASAMAGGASPPAPVERRLPSGARVLALPRGGSDTVLFAVAVEAGSWDEPQGRAGMSHFLEHLLFDGVPGLDERGITESFERLGAYANAFTREQTTVFFVLAPSESAAEASRLLVRMLTEPTIPEQAFEKEKKVILEELARDASRPEGVLDEQLRAALFAGTPAARPVGGAPDDVRAATREEVVAYHRAHYVGSRFRVLVAGDRPADDLLALADPLAAVPGGDGPAARPDLRNMPGWGTMRAVPLPEGARPRLELILAPAGKEVPTLAQAAMLARWLEAADGPLARLRERDDVVSVGAGVRALRPVPLLDVSVVPTAEADARALLRELLVSLARIGAAPEPSRAAIARLARAERAERERMLQRLHYAAILFGEEFAAASGPLADALVPPAVGPDETATAARAFLANPRGRTRAAVAFAGAERGVEPLPEPAPPAAESPVVTVAGGSWAAGPERSRVKVLDNGLTLGVLEEPGGTVFGLHLLVADRALRESGPAGTADLLHRLLGEGTDLSDDEGVAARLEQLGVELKTADNPHIPFDDRYDTAQWAYLRMEGPADSLPGALELLAEVIRAPNWDDDGWRRAKSAFEMARRAAASGRAGSRLLAQRLLGPDHPLARPVPGNPDDPVPTPAQVAALLGEWPGGWFAPPRLILTVASPWTAEEIEDLARPLLGGGPAAKPARGPWPEPAPAEVPAGEEPVSGDSPRVIVAWGRLAEVPEGEQPALGLALDAVSDRTVARIREKEGLAYRLGAGAQVLPDGRWLLRAIVTTRPENRERVEALLGQILAGLPGDPPDAAALERLAGRDRRTRMLRGLAAVSRAERLGRALYLGRGTGSPDSARPTPEQVAAAARRWLDPGTMIRVVGR